MDLKTVAENSRRRRGVVPAEQSLPPVGTPPSTEPVAPLDLGGGEGGGLSKELFMGLSTILPTLIGAAAGGAEGGAAGSKVGQNALDQYLTLSQKEYETKRKETRDDDRFDKTQAGLDRRNKTTADALTARTGAKTAAKQSDYEKTANVPGFELDTAHYKPQPKEIADFRKSKTVVEKIHKAIDSIDGMLEVGGTAILPGPKKQKLVSELRNLGIQMKEYDNLGVLNGPDMQILTQQIGDPTSLVANLQPKYAKTMRAVLANLKNGTMQGITLQGANMGYRPAGQPVPQATDAATPPAPKFTDDELWEKYDRNNP